MVLITILRVSQLTLYEDVGQEDWDDDEEAKVCLCLGVILRYRSEYEWVVWNIVYRYPDGGGIGGRLSGLPKVGCGIELQRSRRRQRGMSASASPQGEWSPWGMIKWGATRETSAQQGGISRWQGEIQESRWWVLLLMYWNWNNGPKLFLSQQLELDSINLLVNANGVFPFAN